MASVLTGRLTAATRGATASSAPGPALRPVRVAAPFLAAGALAFTGLAKINDPSPASDFLVELVSIRSIGLVRAMGFAEVLLALWLVSWVGRRAALLTGAAAFTGFAVVHGWAGSAGVEASCGCAGASDAFDSIPHTGWVAINAGAALLTAAAAGSRPRVAAQCSGPPERALKTGDSS